MLKRFTVVKSIIQVFLVLFFLTQNNWAAQTDTTGTSFKSLSLLGVNKVFLHVQNSKLTISSLVGKKKEIKIFSDFSSLLNKLRVKQIKKLGVLHIWIFKDSFLKIKKNINKNQYIGEIFVSIPKIKLVVVQDLGSVFVKSWQSFLSIKKWNGLIDIKNSKAEINIFSKKAKININNYQGQLKIQSYNSQLNINNSTGVFKLDIFSGDIYLNKIAAKFYLSTYKANVIAEDIEKTLQIKAQNSSIKLTKVKSSVKINIIKGKVELSKIAAVSINVLSTGPALITLHLNKRAAKLSLWSQKFKIKTPKGLKHKSFGRGEQVKGLLEGIKPKAFVVLKNIEGRIKLKP